MSTAFPKKSFIKIIFSYILLLLKFCEGNPEEHFSCCDVRYATQSNQIDFFCIAKYKFPQKKKKYANLSYNTISILRHPLTLPCRSFSFLFLYILVYLRYSVSLFLPLPVFPHPFHFTLCLYSRFSLSQFLLFTVQCAPFERTNCSFNLIQV